MDDAVKRFRKRRAERMKIKPTRLDSVEAYRKRRDERLASRMDDDDDGRWVTTENNHKVHISDEGTPDKGNKHVLERMAKGGGGSVNREARKKWDATMKRYTEVLNLMEKAQSKEHKAKVKFIQSDNIGEIFQKAKSVYHGESMEEMSQKRKDAESSLSTPEDWNNYEKLAHAEKFMKLFGEDALTRNIEDLKAEVGSVDSFRLAGEEIDLRKELSGYVREAFPKLTDCDSNTAMELRIASGDLFETSEFDTQYTSLGKMDNETRSAVANGVQKMFDKYPKLTGKLGAFSVGWTMNEGAYAESGAGGVKLSDRMFENRELITKCLEEDERRGFHPKGVKSIESVVTHEYGHQIDRFFNKRFEDELGGREFSEYVLGKVAEKMGMESSEIKKAVSEYSMQGKGDHEFLAEAFAEYMCSESPRPVAVEVGRIVKEFADRL